MQFVKYILTAMILLTMQATLFAKTVLIVTSNLDENSMPVDKLESVPFSKDRQYLLFLYNDDYLPFGADKIYFEIRQATKPSQPFTWVETDTLATDAAWNSCYQPVFFSSPGSYKIRVFTAAREFTTRFIDVVKPE
jgi:hypothetical protein